MPARYPPQPIYPYALDTWYTLFQVSNTVETIISADNDAWSQEISIRPVTSDKEEIWATITDNNGTYTLTAQNGFATISGELLYYDSVGLTTDPGSITSLSRVNTLKGCVRNLAGSSTQFNPRGTDIRSFVIAEHHNQIAQAIIQIEKYINILNLPSVPTCPEDNNCPQVNFNYTTTATTTNTDCASTQIDYNLSIQGNVDNFSLDFGDGTSTTNATSGTHTYASGATINPVVVVGNANCQTVVGSSSLPAPTTPGTFEIPVIIGNIPDISIPSITISPPDISIPPLVLPYISMSPISIGPISIGDNNNISIPSTISIIAPTIPNISIAVPSAFPEISIATPSFPIEVSIGSISIPGSISITGMPSTISIGGSGVPSVISLDQNIPSSISIIGCCPSYISMIGCCPSYISMIGAPSTISLVGLSNPVLSVIGLSNISVVVPSFPEISVAWGSPPTLSCNVSVTCPGGSPSMLLRSMVDDEWDDLGLPNLAVNYDVGGIPSQIEVGVPVFPKIEIDASSLPSRIILEALNMPEKIIVEGMKEMVSEIKILVPSELPVFKIDAGGLPKSIPIDWGTVPAKIDLNVVNMPSVISVEHTIPSTISVEGMVDTITVQGIPDFLPIKWNDPEDKILRVEPIDIKVSVDLGKLITDGTDDGEGQPCFRLVPCEL